MFAPQPDYTPVPHKLLEQYATIHLSSNQWQVLHFIIRQTLGWHKKFDKISNSQFVEKTGLCKAVVSRSLKELEARNLITRNGKIIGIQEDWNTWKLAESSTKVSNNANKITDKKLAISSVKLAESSTKVSSRTVTQKKKETIQKKYSARTSGPGVKLSKNLFIAQAQKELIAKMQKELGFPDKCKVDPIPNLNKEAWFINRMIKRGFTKQEIFKTWLAKIQKRGEFVSMYYVNEDIGRHYAKNSFPGLEREYPDPPE